MRTGRHSLLSLLPAPLMAAAVASLLATPAAAKTTSATAERPLGILFQTSPRPFVPGGGMAAPAPVRQTSPLPPPTTAAAARMPLPVENIPIPP